MKVGELVRIRLHFLFHDILGSIEKGSIGILMKYESNNYLIFIKNNFIVFYENEFEKL